MDKIQKIKRIFAVIMILSGALVFSYPFISNYLANRNATVAVEEYENQVDDMDQADIDAIKKAAEERNAALQEVTPTDADSAKEDTYLDLVNVGSAIGYITIPVIDLNLPIYEGTTDDILAKGIGHLTETSYPVGGENTHAVLSGHRGLAEAELFTNLDKVQVGDHFYLHVLDDVLAYEVDQIEVVLPEDTSSLQVVSGEDLCSLVTCTPIGINSHRLVVRGHRIEYTGEDDGSHSLYQSIHTGTAMQRLVRIWPWLALTAILVMFAEFILCMMITRRMRERMEED